MSVFRNIFKKKEPMVPFDLSFLGTDIHSHLIPGIDDGSKSPEESLILSQGLLDLGYKKSVTTPHIMGDYYRNTPEIINKGLGQVNNQLAEKSVQLNLTAAAEYYIDYDFMSKIAKEPLLTFGDNYVLVEFSFVEPPRTYKDAFFELQTNGYRPVLAHPERYMYWFNDPTKLFDLKDRNILFQLNILSLVGAYGVGSIKLSELLLQNSMIEWLGTDLHNEYQLMLLKNLILPEKSVKLLNSQKYLNQTL